ncbi:MAG: S-layer homology domain-containing protein [Solobacterium sp.]|nr:S-layer homology domain-containing protein [Solobacterium sp.]
MKKTLTMLMAFVLTLGHSTGFVYAQETAEPEDEPVQETIVSEEAEESEQEITVSEEVEETTEVQELEAGTSCTITFDANGGYFPWTPNGSTTQYLVEGTTGEQLGTNVFCSNDDKHKSFAGWSRTKNGEVDLDQFYMYQYVPSSSETFYAVWDDAYCVTYDPNGGYIPWLEEGECEYYSVKKGNKLPGFPSTENHNTNVLLAGWSFTKDGNVDLDEDNYWDYELKSDITLFAVWKEYYTVTLNGNGGHFLWTGQDDDTLYKIKVVKGKRLNTYEEPEMSDDSAICAGYSHTKDGSVEISIDDMFEYVPEGDETLYAVWGEAITINFDANGGYYPYSESENEQVYSYKMTKGAQVDIYVYPETNQSGKMFIGWSKTKGGAVEIDKNDIAEYVPEASETLYAVWKDCYTITLNANGGYFDWISQTDNTILTITVEKGKNVDTSEIPVNYSANMAFAGWSHSKTGNVEIGKYDLYDYVPTKTETLYAIWKEGYTITFDAGIGYFYGDPDEKTYSTTCVKGERLNSSMSPHTDQAGMIFAGWSKTKNGNVDINRDNIYSYIPTKSETLYAVFKQGYTITLDTNGGYFNWGEHVTSETFDVIAGEPCDRNYTPVHDQTNLAFAGWSHSKTGDAEIKKYELYNYIPKKSEILYAIFKEGYTVTIDFNGGYENWGEGPITSEVVKTVKGEPLNFSALPTYKEAGKVLVGWSHSKTGKAELGKHALYNYVPAKNETLYAVWGDGYVITLDANGGVFAELNNDKTMLLTIEKGMRIDVFVPDPELINGSKKVFAGWSHTKTGDVEIPIYNLFEYVPNKTETLYAVYKSSIFQFSDVKDKTKSYYIPVYWAVGRKITTGKTATTFAPGDPCTRAQFVTFLWRAMGSPEPKSTKNPFVDVPAGKSFTKAILWAYEKKITTGTDATHFSPNKTCTRAQVATFLWRNSGKPVMQNVKSPFTDVPKGLSYSDAVLWAYEFGITTGTSPTTFSPDKTCTRAQTVTFLYRNFAYR